ncbi:MAG: GNAT family N-acetyltransferase [Paludibacteraceae bacterium]
MNDDKNPIVVQVASEKHLQYVETILDTIADAARVRGTGIARRTPQYIEQKMREGKAIIALHGDDFAGFCYIETWGDKKFVANSGLIVVEKFRGNGLAKKIKQRAFQLSRERYPDAKIFGLTTGLAVMKINSELGYRPVTFSELTDDDAFWKGCESCINYDILLRTNRKHCLCTGMIYDPAWSKKETENQKSNEKSDSNPMKKVVKAVGKVILHKKKKETEEHVMTDKITINLL